MFLDGTLWGSKFIATDRRTAIREMRDLVDRLARKIESLDDEIADAP
jgi:hypothetical protein